MPSHGLLGGARAKIRAPLFGEKPRSIKETVVHIEALNISGIKAGNIIFDLVLIASDISTF